MKRFLVKSDTSWKGSQGLFDDGGEKLQGDDYRVKKIPMKGETQGSWLSVAGLKIGEGQCAKSNQWIRPLIIESATQVGSIIRGRPQGIFF